MTRNKREDIHVDIEEMDLRLLLNNVRQFGSQKISIKQHMTAIFYTNILMLNELTEIKEILNKKNEKR
jgi:hypothetical protein